MLGVFDARCIVVRKFASYEEVGCQENSSSLTVIRCLSPPMRHDDEFYVCRVFLDQLWWKFTYIRDGIPWWYGLCQVNQWLGNARLFQLKMVYFFCCKQRRRNQQRNKRKTRKCASDMKKPKNVDVLTKTAKRNALWFFSEFVKSEMLQLCFSLF